MYTPKWCILFSHSKSIARILDKQFDCKPKNFFDTQIAASLLGKKSIGLGSLLEEYLKVNKESKFQKADWTRRPLSVGMLSYASKDTSYLIPLYKILKKELQEKKRLAWIEQELDSLEHKEFKLRIQKFEDLKKLNTLNPKELGILKKLYQLRRKIAKELDEPVHHIISTKRLFEIAQRPPNVWKRIKRVHPIIYRRASLFQQAVEEGRKHPVEIKKKESKRHTPEEKLKFKQLQDIQKKVAEKQKIPGHLIINKEQMLSLIVKKDKTALRKWQITLLKKEKPKFFV